MTIQPKTSQRLSTTDEISINKHYKPLNIGTVHALSISHRKGTPKSNVQWVEMKENWGIIGDAHAGPGHRQISLLNLDSVEKMKKLGAKVKPGSFAENITTKGFPLEELRIGDRVKIGECLLEITQIGKECHNRCAIYKLVGDCVMPREGVFGIVLKGGRVQVGDEIALIVDHNDL